MRHDEKNQGHVIPFGLRPWIWKKLPWKSILPTLGGGVVMPCVQAQLTEMDVRNLLELAAKRGVDANTVLQQAIATEKLIADNVGPKDDLIIKRPDNSYLRVEFKKLNENP